MRSGFIFRWRRRNLRGRGFAFLPGLKNVFLFADLRWRHFGKRVDVVLDLRYAEVKDLGHCQTLRRAHGGAKPAKTALGHVDIEPGGVYAFGRTVRCFPEFLNSSYGLDLDTIHRADLRALIAYDAIINLIMQTITAVVRHGNHFVGILNGGDTFRV